MLDLVLKDREMGGIGNIKYSSEIRSQIVDMYLNKDLIKDICKEFGCGETTLHRIIRETGIKAGGPRRRAFSEGIRDSVMVDYLNEISNKEICVKYKFSDTTRQNILKEKKVLLIRNEPKFSKKERLQVFDLYKSGMSSCYLAKKFKCSDATIRSCIKNFGYKTRNRSESMKKYTFNEHYFDILDTEEKVYWLSFLSADGSIQHRPGRIKELKLELAKVDENHIIKFLHCLEANHPIYHINRNRDGIVSSFASVRLSSNQLVLSLERYGVTPRKTFTMKPYKNIPEKYKPAYFRGWLDGDGYISKEGTSVYFLGTKSVVTACANFINPIVGSKARVRPNKNIFRISYGGRQLTKKILSLLYLDATIFLDRKKALADKALLV